MDQQEKHGIKILDVDRIPADHLDYFTGTVFGWDNAVNSEVTVWDLIQKLTSDGLEFFTEYRPQTKTWTSFFATAREDADARQIGEGSTMVESVARAALKAYKRGITNA